MANASSFPNNNDDNPTPQVSSLQETQYSNPHASHYLLRPGPVDRHRMLEDMVNRHESARLIEAVEASATSGGQSKIVRALAQDGKALVEVAKHITGLRSVIGIIEAIKTSPDLILISAAIGPRGAAELMNDSVGSKLVTHCLAHLEYKHNKFIFQAATVYRVELAKSNRGSESLLKCIRKAESPDLTPILEAITKSCYILSTHKIGSGVIRDVIEDYGDSVDLGNGRYVSEVICLKLAQHLKKLSKDAYASHVLQSCLGTSAGGIHVLEKLATMDVHTLMEIAKDPFGNYVLQGALNTNYPGFEHHERLVGSLSPLRKELAADPYAKNVLKYLKK